MEASSGATKLDFNNSLFKFPETLNGSGLNVLAYLCFFNLIRLEPFSSVLFFSLSQGTPKYAQIYNFSVLSRTWIFFSLFCGSAIQTVLIVLFLLKHDVSCMYRGVSECVCGVIRTVFLESFHLWCGWCQSYVFTNNVLMVTHINSLFTNNDHEFSMGLLFFLQVVTATQCRTS